MVLMPAEVNQIPTKARRATEAGELLVTVGVLAINRPAGLPLNVIVVWSLRSAQTYSRLADPVQWSYGSS